MFASLFAPDVIEEEEEVSQTVLQRQDKYESLPHTSIEVKEAPPVLDLRNLPVYRSISTAAREVQDGPFIPEKRTLSVPEFWFPSSESFLEKFKGWLAIVDDPKNVHLRCKCLETLHHEFETDQHSYREMLPHVGIIRQELLARLMDSTWDASCKDWIYKIYCVLDPLKMSSPILPPAASSEGPSITKPIGDIIPEVYAELLMRQNRVKEILPIVYKQLERGQSVEWVRGIITEGQVLILEQMNNIRDPYTREVILREHLRLYREQLRELIGAKNDDTLLVT